MHLFIIIKVLAALSVFSTLIAGAAILPNDPTINAMVAQWSGVSIKGHNITMNGTLSQVLAQLEELGADWVPVPIDESDTSYGPPGTTRVTYDMDMTTIKDLATVRRAGIPPPDPEPPTSVGNSKYLSCCPVAAWNWEQAFIPLIQRSIAKMQKVGLVTSAPGGQCVIAECFNDVGIWFCSEDPYTTWSALASQLASYATAISKCPGDEFTCGQKWSISGESWDVIVHEGCN